MMLNQEIREKHYRDLILNHEFDENSDAKKGRKAKKYVFMILVKERGCGLRNLRAKWADG